MRGSRAAALAALGIFLALGLFGALSAGRMVGWVHLADPGSAEGSRAETAPLAFDDYALQYYFGRLGSHFLAREGATYGYDPDFMAGYVKMPLYYPSSKPYEFSLLVQSQWLGVPSARAFNRTVYALLVSLPFLAFAAAWLWGMTRAERLVVMGLACVPHMLVPMVGYYSIMEAAGMVSFVFAASLSLVVIALVKRTLDEPRWPQVTALSVAGPLLILSHPTASFLVAVPVTALYVAHARRASARAHVALWGALALALALNGVWLRGLLLFGHYADVGDFYTPGGRDHFAPPGGWLAPFRVSVGSPWLISLLPPTFGIAGLVLWWREKRTDPLLAFGPQSGALFAVAFYGVHFGLSAIGPARITLPLGLTLLFPAAHALVRTAGWCADWIDAHAPAGSAVWLRGAALLGLAGVPLIAGLPSHAFRPYAIPELQARNGYDPTGRELLDWLRANTDASGRLLHEETDRLSHRYYGSHLPALIPIVAGVPLAGGPAPHALLQHNHLRFIAGTFRNKRLGRVPFAEMSRYLGLYNVQWVLCWSPAAKQYFEGHPLATEASTFDKFSLFEVALAPSYFARGQGRVTARPNRLDLDEVVPREGVITLKYHWLETLRTDPPREIEPTRFLDDPVPFITVKDPPRSLAIVNAYTVE